MKIIFPSRNHSGDGAGEGELLIGGRAFSLTPITAGAWKFAINRNSSEMEQSAFSQIHAVGLSFAPVPVCSLFLQEQRCASFMDSFCRSALKAVCKYAVWAGHNCSLSGWWECTIVHFCQELRKMKGIGGGGGSRGVTDKQLPPTNLPGAPWHTMRRMPTSPRRKWQAGFRRIRKAHIWTDAKTPHIRRNCTASKRGGPGCVASWPYTPVQTALSPWHP